MMNDRQIRRSKQLIEVRHTHLKTVYPKGENGDVNIECAVKVLFSYLSTTTIVCGFFLSSSRKIDFLYFLCGILKVGWLVADVVFSSVFSFVLV